MRPVAHQRDPVGHAHRLVGLVGDQQHRGALLLAGCRGSGRGCRRAAGCRGRRTARPSAGSAAAAPARGPAPPAAARRRRAGAGYFAAVAGHADPRRAAPAPARPAPPPAPVRPKATFARDASGAGRARSPGTSARCRAPSGGTWRARVRDDPAGDRHAARVLALDAGGDAQERRLAAARGPEQAGHLAARAARATRRRAPACRRSRGRCRSGQAGPRPGPGGSPSRPLPPYPIKFIGFRGIASRAAAGKRRPRATLGGRCSTGGTCRWTTGIPLGRRLRLGSLQNLVDATLPARTSRTELLQDLGVQPDRSGDLRIDRTRPTSAHWCRVDDSGPFRGREIGHLVPYRKRGPYLAFSRSFAFLMLMIRRVAPRSVQASTTIRPSRKPMVICRCSA